MPRLKRPKGEFTIDQNELSQEIDLSSYIDGEINEEVKRTFADLAVDVITNRTLNGNTINGGKFAKYTKRYADLKGVTVDSVDLFLEGDMLDGIGRDDQREDESTVLIALDENQTPKGYNHNVGDTVKKREWFGLTENEVKNIVRRMGRSTGQGRRVTLSDLRSQLSNLGIQQTD